MKYYTTAPKDYDGFSTKEIKSFAGIDNYNAKIYRFVETDDCDIDWQKGRNSSGMHPCISETDFADFIKRGFIYTKQPAARHTDES